jgi:hypothetical protein
VKEKREKEGEEREETRGGETVRQKSLQITSLDTQAAGH